MTMDSFLPELGDVYRSWQGRLLDLSGRNHLVSFRDLKVGNFRLQGEDPLQWLEYSNRGTQKSLDLLAARGDLSREELLKKTQVIARKHASNLEERGVSTLKVISHLVSWQHDGKSYRVPIVLQNLELPKNVVFTNVTSLLLVEDTLELNPNLGKLLTDVMHIAGADVLVEKFQEDIDNWLDTDIVNNRARITAMALRICTVLSQFDATVDTAVHIGNFHYQSLPMVQDLEVARCSGYSSPLVEALAGVGDARQALTIQGTALTEPATPDDIVPQDEALVLDADSSQSRVIARALAGQSLVIQGPPGTGKSQTISNLVASFIAAGKSVLFVAEKRAAVEAVTHRLESAGLGHLVLNLHGQTEDKRHLYERLGRSLEQLGASGEPHDPSAELVAARSMVLARSELHHAPLDPWGVSPYEVMQTIVGLRRDLPEYAPMLPHSLGATLTSERIEEIRQVVDSYVQLGGTDPTVRLSPWYLFSSQEREEVALVAELADDLRQALLVSEQMFATENSASATIGDFLQNIAQSVRYKELHDRLGESLLTQPYLAQLEAVAAGTPVFEGQKLGFFERRRLVKNATTLLPAPLGRKALLSALLEIRSMQDWKESMWSSGTPQFDATEASALLQRLHSLLHELYLRVMVPPTMPLRTVVGMCDELLSGFHTLGWKMPEIRRQEELLEDFEVRSLVETLAEGSASSGQIAPLVLLALWSAVGVAMNVRLPELTALDAQHLDAQVETFQVADRTHIVNKSAQISRRAEIRLRDELEKHPEQALLLRENVKKSRRQLPLRQLIDQAPDVLQSLHPAWALSPLEVAQILPLGHTFDLVVFDEASQIQPHEAAPALLRGRQLVVAGDRYQLPPTTFFANETVSDTAVEDSSDYESLLDVMDGILGNFLLSWHYRSQDERLIAVSNTEIYGGSLVTFPGARGADAISFHRVEDNSGTDSSATEIQQVVDLLVHEATHHPTRSLGVITLNLKHAERIQNALDKRVSSSSALQSQLRRSTEPLFVKNIERVQGDERDTIVISTGYTKDAQGRLPQRFGPINQEGGERRLNVMASRSKQRMVLVSSFTSKDISDQSPRRGVQVLRAFFSFMEQGGKLATASLDIPTLNALEQDIQERLTKQGLHLVPQHGCSGHRVNFAVAHPTRPGAFVLAVETDNPSYRNLPAARDRDRLRQEHLERLGWRFHRIWSASWFQDADKEVEKVMHAYKKALSEVDKKAPAPRLIAVATTPAAPSQRGPVPVHTSDAPRIDDYSDEELLELAQWVASDQRIRTTEQVSNEMFQVLGFRRTGPKIRRRLGEAALVVSAR